MEPQDKFLTGRRAHAGGEEISRSWQRCRQAGLIQERSCLDLPHYSRVERREAAGRRASLITQARPIIDYIYGQVRDSGCILLLSDESGFLLDSIGDTEFCSRAAQVALQPGACWAEDARGTNAVGTALVEGKPVVVNGAEHYLRHNNFLACAAAPLAEPNGKLIGVIDISCDSRAFHPHTFGLVRAAAQMIENRIFELSFHNHTKLRFHVSRICVGSLVEGAVALSEDGKIIGANRSGFSLLHLGMPDIGRIGVEELFGLSFPKMIDLDRAARGPLQHKLASGAKIFVTIDQVKPPQFKPVKPAPVAPCDPLETLNTGDARIATAIAHARRVLGKAVPILLRGETGTGKDYFARAIHAAGPRAHGPFIAVNCAALPETLIESELFGHSSGAFTGARREGAIGRIREAHGGTLFLDEIGDMPVQMQTRLLQVLEDRQVTPLGGKPVKVDFVLISATHCNLNAAIATHGFRPDLYYRLNGLAIELPPLRDRTDIAALINAILRRESGQTPPPMLSDRLAAALRAHHWPGNIRQLASILRIACLMRDPGDAVLDWRHLSEQTIQDLTAPPPAPPRQAASLRAHSDLVIAQAVQAAGGNIAAAARNLQISRNTLYRRLAAASLI
jgi:transcriptional regulator of acetoin/glycerol metabolism